MMNDDLDDLIRGAAQGYHEPPVVPREAMWDAITRAREDQLVTPIGRARRAPRWLAAVTSVAAILMVGFALGRVSHPPEAPAAQVASTSERRAAGSSDSSESRPSADLPTSVRDDATPRSTHVVAPGTNRRGSLRATAAVRSAVPNDQGGDPASYRLAVVEHLARTEVMLAGFRSQVRSNADGRIDVQFVSLSRDLLATTRLLLATHHGDDPAMTRLLQDLELVLMQLSQYANDGRRGDLDAVEQSMEKHNVMPKLRSTIPAGFSASSGT